MAAPASLIPELEDVVQHGSAERRAETLQRITTLFLDGASRFNEDHVQLFDDVFGRLIEEIEAKARAELSDRLAPVGNAPVEVVRRLAQDDDIAVAGPVLAQSSRLAEADLVEIARTKSQAHLLAISGPHRHRRAGDRRAGQPRRPRGRAQRRRQPRRPAVGDSFSTLVDRAEKDGVLAEKVGLRARHPAAAVPRSSAQGDRGRAAAPARGRQAGDAGRNPARARQGRRARSAPKRRRATIRRRSERSRRCARRASSTRPRWSISPSASKYEETVRRSRRCARCRSRWSTA